MSLLVRLLELGPVLLSGRHLHGDAQLLVVAAGGGHLLKGAGEEAGGGAGLVLRGPGVGREGRAWVSLSLAKQTLSYTSDLSR